MESLTEQIAAEIGPKWVQLLSRLQLDYKESSRERFRLCTQYKDYPKHEQEINCARDTIKLWQKRVGEISEKEMMTQLLTTLRKVKGFEERAKELSESYGITLAALPAVSAVTTTVSTTATPTLASRRYPASDGTTVTTTLTELHTVTQSTTLTSHARHSLDLPHSLANREESKEHDKLLKPQTESPIKKSCYEQSEDNLSLLCLPVDISVTRHKYAILDICQRLPASILPHLAQKLSISQEKVREISANFPMAEERYYQVLKHWLCAGSTQRTFVDLKGALEECQQHTVSDFILRRLQSTGLTLRSPAL